MDYTALISGVVSLKPFVVEEARKTLHQVGSHFSHRYDSFFSPFCMCSQILPKTFNPG